MLSGTISYIGSLAIGRIQCYATPQGGGRYEAPCGAGSHRERIPFNRFRTLTDVIRLLENRVSL